MKSLFKPVLAAGLVLMAASPLATAPAAAQELKTIGVVNIPLAVAQTNAFKVAEQQRPVTYKPTIDAAQTCGSQLKAQLQPVADKLQADSKLPNANQQQLQQRYEALQQLGQQGQREIDQIMQPVALSQEYVQEQIQDQLAKAIDNTAKAKGVSLVLNVGDVVVYRTPSYDMTQALTDEINKLLPVAQLVPPPGWLPRELREQQAQQAAAQGQAAAPPAATPAATPAGPAANGR